jgi:DNA-binding response OmpR family regulator
MIYDREQLSSFVESGLTLGEIGDEMGKTAHEIRNALRRRGMRAVHANEKTLRQKVEGMKPVEAVEFLLACVENLSSGLCGREHETDSWMLPLTPMQRRVLICLYDAGGAVVTKDALMSALYFDRPGDVPEIKIVDVMICKIRPKIPANRGRVETIYGLGVRWVSA